MTNGVLLDSHQATWAYDSCGGHSDKKHQYHYHIPPHCFLKDHGVATPEDADWWIDDSQDKKVVRNYANMSDVWPDSDEPSPVLGFARDGFPIMGPYDADGTLQRGKMFGGKLDECNGKMDINDDYAYYFTVDPPFAPPCLRGDVGVFSFASTEKKCPANGIVTTFVDVKAEMKEETKGETKEEAKKEASIPMRYLWILFAVLAVLTIPCYRYMERKFNEKEELDV